MAGQMAAEMGKRTLGEGGERAGRRVDWLRRAEGKFWEGLRQSDGFLEATDGVSRLKA